MKTIYPLVFGLLLLSGISKAQQPISIGKNPQISAYAEGVGFVGIFKGKTRSRSCSNTRIGYFQEFTLEKLTEEYKWEIISEIDVTDNDSIWSLGGLAYYKNEFFVVANTSRHGLGLFKIQSNQLVLVKNWPKIMSKCSEDMVCFKGYMCTWVPTNLSIAMGKMYFNAPSRLGDETSSSYRRYEYQLHESDGTTEGTKKAQVSKDDARLESDHLASNNYLVIPKTHGFGNPYYFLQVITPTGAFRIHDPAIGKKIPALLKSRIDPDIFYMIGEQVVYKIDVLKQKKTVAFEFSGEFDKLSHTVILRDDELFFQGYSKLSNETVWGVCNLAKRKNSFYTNINPDNFQVWTARLLGESLFIFYGGTDSSGIVEFPEYGGSKFYKTEPVSSRWNILLLDLADAYFVYQDRKLFTFRPDDPELVFDLETWTGSTRDDGIIPRVFSKRKQGTSDDEFYVFKPSSRPTVGSTGAKKGFRTIRVFMDDNFNGVWDVGENSVGNVKVKIGNKWVYTDRFGRAFVSYDSLEYDDVDIVVEYDKGTWDVHPSTPAEIKVKKEMLLENVTHFVGLGNLKNHNVRVKFYESRSRCRSPKTITAEVFNATPRSVKAEIVLNIDTLNKIDSFPEHFEQINDTIFKTSITIAGGQIYKSIFYTTVDDSLGLNINNEFAVKSEFFDEVVIDEERKRESVIRCSYDPNDKSSKSNGVWKEEFLLKSDTNELEYIIQFQNYGNDTAYDVKILDQLSSHLDWSSFEFLGASHYTVVSINDGGELKFDFQDIMLPDTGVNMAGSMGYARYGIKPKSDLAHRTAITNKAAIYFDFNDPIITNTTKNIWVHDMPVDVPQFISTTLKDDITIKLDYKTEDPFTKEIEIYRSINDTLNYTLVSSESNTSNEWLDKSPREDAIFYYKLRAVNGQEKSDWSDTKSLIYKKSGIDNSRLESMVSIYPNPAQNQLAVRMKAEQSAQLWLLDMKGKQILKQTISGSTVLEVGHLPKGPYMLKVEVDGRQMEKLISLQ